MARRKKEPANVHRQRIADAAQVLFLNKGIENTTMDDIAREAGYGKATLYVYFKDKKEVVAYLALESMEKIYKLITSDITNRSGQPFRKKYDAVCDILVDYSKRYPFYFSLLQDNINVDFDNDTFLPEEKETFIIGEKINECLAAMLKEAMDNKEIRQNDDIFTTAFTLWLSMAGIISASEKKKEYIEKVTGEKVDVYLKKAFDFLYHSLL
ncbi:MAG: TetR/AcrR family transcriptional regulator [Tissierellia bacterium]|jgi:AcrR family transcriptional regulator|nr:TetR/AcrR family transcriptional regulator [Tissierellia bacterium]